MRKDTISLWKSYTSHFCAFSTLLLDHHLLDYIRCAIKFPNHQSGFVRYTCKNRKSLLLEFMESCWSLGPTNKRRNFCTIKRKEWWYNTSNKTFNMFSMASEQNKNWTDIFSTYIYERHVLLCEPTLILHELNIWNSKIFSYYTFEYLNITSPTTCLHMWCLEENYIVAILESWWKKPNFVLPLFL